MELIAKISKGTKMDQVYIPKNRVGLEVGSYVIIKHIIIRKPVEKPCFYNVKDVEPLKLEIVNEIFNTVDELIRDYENIIITGSFLNKGFYFGDIDVILISNMKLNEKQIRKSIEDKLKIKIHLITLNNKSLIKGLEIDPLYQMILSRCIAKKRFIYKTKRKFNYKILDLHLLKSKLLIINFDYLTGDEKYYLTRNMVAIFMFLKYKKINKENVDKNIKKIFNLTNINEIKNNIIQDKKDFLKRYNKFYKKVFNKIMESIKNSSE